MLTLLKLIEIVELYNFGVSILPHKKGAFITIKVPEIPETFNIIRNSNDMPRWACDNEKSIWECEYVEFDSVNDLVCEFKTRLSEVLRKDPYTKFSAGTLKFIEEYGICETTVESLTKRRVV